MCGTIHVMSEVEVVSSLDLSAVQVGCIRLLLADAFHDRFSDDDWDHALGGWHAVVMVGGAVVSHAAVVRRQIEVGSRRVTAGYVEAVATAPAAQGVGHGSQAVRAVMDVLRREFEMGALSTGRHRFYERLGWERWEGPSFVVSDGQRMRTAEEDGGIMVLRFGPSADLSLESPIACRSRQGDDW